EVEQPGRGGEDGARVLLQHPGQYPPHVLEAVLDPHHGARRLLSDRGRELAGGEVVALADVRGQDQHARRPRGELAHRAVARGPLFCGRLDHAGRWYPRPSGSQRSDLTVLMKSAGTGSTWTNCWMRLRRST